MTDDTNWTSYYADRERRLANRNSLVPDPPGGAAFVETLCTGEIRPEAGAFTRRLIHGLDAPTADLVALACAEAAGAAAVLGRGGMVISNGDTFATALPPIYPAFRYLHGVLGWSHLALNRTRARKGQPSEWRLVPTSPVESGRRRHEPRRTGWENDVPWSEARDRADRITAWLAEALARRIAGTPAILCVVAVPCSAGVHCIAREGRIADSVDEDAGTVILDLLARPTPAVTQAASAGRRHTLCDACHKVEGRVRHLQREDRGYPDPLGSKKRLGQVEYRRRLAEVEEDTGLAACEVQDAIDAERTARAGRTR